jgi:uracil-DNA glycosylase
MRTNTLLKNDWKEQLGAELKKSYFQDLLRFLENEYETAVVYPAKEDIFSALDATPYQDVKVVILGQDPYHGPNQAHGMSFSVKPGVPIPPSLRNMFKELEADLEIPFPTHGYLKRWADQGVLLLNTVLTVKRGEANSHKGKGWETFTDRVIAKLNERESPVIFVLWGKPAQQKRKLIDETKHHILTAVHPSPLSAHRGFFGSKPFSTINQLLTQMDKEEINWEL